MRIQHLAFRLHWRAIFFYAVYFTAAFILGLALLLPAYLYVVKSGTEAITLLTLTGFLPFFIGIASLVEKKVNSGKLAGFAAGAALAIALGLGGLL